MKRKLDQKDEPASTQVESAKQPETKQPAEEPSFSDLGLDTRLLQAIAAQNFKKPTLVQYKTIPLALDGQDVITKARCGSGKTMVYVLSILSTILKRKATDSTSYTSALILVPTRELADQVFKVIEKFSAFCAKDIQAVVLKDKTSDAVTRSLLSTSPDIVISTPSTAWRSVDAAALSLDRLACLVLDEADLVLSYGYSDEIEGLARCVPKGAQVVMMSATLTGDMDLLKGMFGRTQALLDLEEPEAEGEGVAQFVVRSGEDEKFLLAYVIFKIQLIKGRCIIFVNDIDRAYRLKLFLEQFYIRSCCLNAELPVNSRIHVIEEFNRGVYEILIAADEKNEMMGDAEDDVKEDAEKAKKKQKTGEEKDGEAQGSKKKRRQSKKDQEYGMSRGIDFKNVSAVINFDFPTSASSYAHRIGRTARAGRNGMALSFYVPQELYRKHMPTTVETAERDEKILARVVKQQAKLGKEVKPYHFKKDEVEAFRYRMNDALRAVTKVAVRAARTRELRQELMKSEKLKRYFEENPAELAHLRHDSELRTAKRQDHLRHVPEYLLPKEGKEALTENNDLGRVSFRKADDRKSRGRGRPRGRVGKPGGGGGGRGGRKGGDPLKTFKARRK